MKDVEILDFPILMISVIHSAPSVSNLKGLAKFIRYCGHSILPFIIIFLKIRKILSDKYFVLKHVYHCNEFLEKNKNIEYTCSKEGVWTQSSLHFNIRCHQKYKNKFRTDNDASTSSSSTSSSSTSFPSLPLPSPSPRRWRRKGGMRMNQGWLLSSF